VNTAQAEAYKLLNDNAPNEQIIKVLGMEAFTKAADGKATKIIIPSEYQSLAGMVSTVSELAGK
jgi:hypothetical protein